MARGDLALPMRHRLALATKPPEGERRRTPRFDVWGEIHIFFGPALLPVLDLSEDGFAVQSPTKFDRDSVSEFTVRTPNFNGVLRARNIHCVPLVGSASPRYIAGFAFTADIADAARQCIRAVEKQIMDSRLAASLPSVDSGE